MNKENYKKAINEIHAPKKLKEKTFEKITLNPNKNKIKIFKAVLATCTIMMIVFLVGAMYFKKEPEEKPLIVQTTTQEKTENNLPRFENIEQLKEVLEENQSTLRKSNDLVMSDEATNQTATAVEESHSTTNTQVENVDEADIVKTDGQYIFYVTGGKLYIVKAEELKIITKLEFEEEKEKIYPSEIYIRGDKLIVLGNSNSYNNEQVSAKQRDITYESVQLSTRRMAKAIVYDISNKQQPKITREVELDGYYVNSRMIGDNLYFISTKNVYIYDEIKDDEILPILRDSAKEETTKIECTDIAYFKGTQSNSYMLVAGFNINNNEQASIETFFGANETVYSSQENLYIAQTTYGDKFDYSNSKSTIYKFILNGSQIKLKCKGEVEGDLNNQFSMDEYDGKLRIATTNGYDDDSTNQLYILDENLQTIGKIENMAKGEKIYSVRFIGKVGYVVTFKQIDPLFIIDLSNPEKPVIKGELKIPGYSSYLHPYDETHIIGIGHNTKTNKYGNITNDSMKMSMFDISDLENPKEIFNVNIGKGYTYSEIESNHKSLFYNKEQNLIGFPLTYREENAKDDKNGFIIYKIDLQNGFEKYGEILQSIDYRTNIDRAIYIGNTLYTLSETKIISYDLQTINKIQELEL